MCFVPSGTALSSLQTGRGERAWTPKRTYIQALPLGTHRWLSFLLKGPRLESSCRQVAKSGSPLWARPSLQMIEHKARAEGKVALRKKKKKVFLMATEHKHPRRWGMGTWSLCPHASLRRGGIRDQEGTPRHPHLHNHLLSQCQNPAFSRAGELRSEVVRKLLKATQVLKDGTPVHQNGVLNPTPFHGAKLPFE